MARKILKLGSQTKLSGTEPIGDETYRDKTYRDKTYRDKTSLFKPSGQNLSADKTYRLSTTLYIYFCTRLCLPIGFVPIGFVRP